MIVKNIDKKSNLKKFQEFGHKAEQQMAFYLKRAFQDHSDIQVINDLRLEMNDDVAQIDHLIIHRFGFIVVESKSVTSKISINEHGEWIRHYPKFTRGMPSPVNQAIRQTDFLKNFLMARTEHLLRKRMVFQSSISDFKFDVLVAISDSGIINRAKGLEINEVHKADHVTASIIALISGYAGTNKKLLTLAVNYQFADSSMKKVVSYLVRSHKPKAALIKEEDKLSIKLDSIKEKTIEAPHTPENEQTCRKCASKNVDIVYGKFGCYFKCADCNGNTPIKLKCTYDSCKPRVRKDKLKFYQECSSCNKSDLYFENTP